MTPGLGYIPQAMTGMHLPTGELAAIGAAMIWALTSLVFTEAGRLTSPIAANTFKVTFATLIFAIVLWARNGVPWGVDITTADVALLAVSGICGLAVGDSLLFLGFQALGARRANLVFALAPVMGASGGFLLLGERLAPLQVAGIVGAIGGVAWVVSERREIARRGRTMLTPGAVGIDDVAHPLEGRTLFGVMVTLGAALGQATGALLAKPALERVATLEATQIRVGAAAVTLLVAGALRGRLRPWAGLIIRRRLYLSMAMASFGGPFLGVWLMSVALDRSSTGVALTLLATPPLWLLPLGAWLQHDHPTRREIFGLCVALTGVAVLLMRAV
jgi:drug/metabolite transporter (DMT)-like permease